MYLAFYDDLIDENTTSNAEKLEQFTQLLRPFFEMMKSEYGTLIMTLNTLVEEMCMHVYLYSAST